MSGCDDGACYPKLKSGLVAKILSSPWWGAPGRARRRVASVALRRGNTTFHYRFADILSMYLGGHRPDSLWTDLWLWPKPRAYRNRRARILLHQAKHRARRIMRRELAKPNPLLSQITKDETWGRGCYYPVPLKFSGDL